MTPSQGLLCSPGALGCTRAWPEQPSCVPHCCACCGVDSLFSSLVTVGLWHLDMSPQVWHQDFLLCPVLGTGLKTVVMGHGTCQVSSVCVWSNTNILDLCTSSLPFLLSGARATGNVSPPVVLHQVSWSAMSLEENSHYWYAQPWFLLGREVSWVFSATADWQPTAAVLTSLQTSDLPRSNVWPWQSWLTERLQTAPGDLNKPSHSIMG